LPDVEIALVVTQYQKGNLDQWFNAVYDYAVENGYRVIVQESASFEYLREMIIKSNIDLLISHAFMRILPKTLFSAPKYGSINIHPSLLPKYRGPSPTEWVISKGEKVTGLTCHYIDEGIDTGDIIYQLDVPVEPNDTVGSIIERQKNIVAPLLAVSLSRVCDRNFKPVPQVSEFASYAPRLNTRG